MSIIMTNENGIRYATELTDSTPKDVPVYNPNGVHRRWNWDDIYFGAEFVGEGTKGRFVPRVGDEVWSQTLGTFYVRSLSSLLIPEIVRWQEPPIAGAEEVDYLLGIGPRHPQEGYFAYVDNTVEPPTLQLDSQLCFYRPGTRYVRIFAGEAPVPNAEVISAWYNQGMEYVNDKIPVYSVSSAKYDGEDITYWVPYVGWAKRKLIKGETICVASYDDQGVNGYSAFIVQDGGYIRQSNAAAREIVSIELISNYMAEPKTLKKLIVPNGLNVDSILFQCRVTTTNGVLDLPIDGQKIRLHGLEEYSPTQVGLEQDLLLYYYLSDEESYAGSLNVTGGSIRETYTIQAKEEANAYAFKLFAYPSWVSEAQGYELLFFLHDIDHETVYDVTKLVELSSNSAEWDPLRYGVKQYMRFALDIQKVDSRFSTWRHTQEMQFTLLRGGPDITGNLWTVYFQNGQSPAYGNGTEAKFKYISSQVWTVDVTCGMKTQDAWLDLLYYRTLPIYSPDLSDEPLKPTHFVFVVAGQRYRRTIDQWQDTIQSVTGGTENATVAIHWIQEVNGTDLYLATSGLVNRRIS